MSKKSIVLLFSLSLSVILLFFSCTIKKVSDEEGGGKRWLLLFYDDADFTNAFDPLKTFAAEAFSHENLDVLILADGENTPATIWRIGSAHELIPMKMVDEVNMADGGTLEYFLKFAAEHYPDRSTILCFYDHGAGCWGACVDGTNDKKDILQIDEMQKAMQNSGKIDLVCFTAPCLMGSLEAAYELRSLTDIYIGSENLSGYSCWMRTIQFIAEQLKNDPLIGNRDLAEKIIQSTYERGYRDWLPGSADYYTMAAYDSGEVRNASNAFLNLCEYILDHPSEVFPLLDQILPEVWYYSPSNPYLADVIDVLERLAVKGAGELSRLSFSAAETIKNSMISFQSGENVSGMKGVNIYLPVPGKSYLNDYYGASGIDFALDTKWYSVLKAYHSSRSSFILSGVSVPIAATNGLIPPRKLNKSDEDVFFVSPTFKGNERQQKRNEGGIK